MCKCVRFQTPSESSIKLTAAVCDVMYQTKTSSVKATFLMRRPHQRNQFFSGFHGSDPHLLSSNLRPLVAGVRRCNQRRMQPVVMVALLALVGAGRGFSFGCRLANINLEVESCGRIERVCTTMCEGLCFQNVSAGRGGGAKVSSRGLSCTVSVSGSPLQGQGRPECVQRQLDHRGDPHQGLPGAGQLPDGPELRVPALQQHALWPLPGQRH